MITYDPTNALIQPGGITSDDLAALAPKLEAARQEVLGDAHAWAEGTDVSADRVPLDAGFHQLPERLLAELKASAARSEIGRLRATAKRLAGEVDRVVVLGIGGSYMGARALLEACCHPYHNELPREARDGVPRMSFEGNNVDNDALQGLLDLLRADKQPWAIVVISKSGGTLETAAAFRVLWGELKKSAGSDLPRRVVPVTGASGKLFDLANAIGCPDVFAVPEGVGGRFSVLSAVGLLPAAILGLDLPKLLDGAATMNEHFRTAPPGENAVLDYVAVCQALEMQQGCDVRILSTWGKRLEAAGLWYDQLLAESLGKQEQGALPLTVVNTRDLHSRGQQHQEGKRDKLVTNLIVESPSHAKLEIGTSDLNQDGLNALSDKTIADILAAAIAGTNQAYREDNRPTADIRLPVLDEYYLGQFFQMMMLATVVEGRLVGINPYGQPGVEAYKRNMNAILRS